MVDVGPEVIGGGCSFGVDGEEAVADSFGEGVDACLMRKADPGGGEGSLLSGFRDEVSGKGLAEKVVEGKRGVGDLVV